MNDPAIQFMNENTTSDIDSQHVLPYLSPLELLHPDGIARRVHVIGSGCPNILLPPAQHHAAHHCDLIVLAPSISEYTRPDWLEQAGRLLVEKLDRDGLVYVVIPSRRRRTVVRMLRRYGLLVKMIMGHLPDAQMVRHLVSLDPAPTEYVLTKLTPMRPWKQHLVRLGLRLPGSHKLLACTLPMIGIVGGWPESRPVFNWLFQTQQHTSPHGTAAISISRHGSQSTAILHGFSEHSPWPSIVVKLALTQASATARIAEAAQMHQLRSVAEQSGAHIPEATLTSHATNYPLIVQLPVPGQTAATLLTARPHRLQELVERIAAWLERWGCATRITRILPADWLEREILTPAALLAPLHPYGTVYQHWLHMRCLSIQGVPIPLVAAHNDLTMWNVLFDTHGNLGIVDWEVSRSEFFPLADFYYSAVDAVFATGHYPDRLSAFNACFMAQGTYSRLIASIQKHLATAIGIDATFGELCFHACWLHHAVNEHLSHHLGASRPFLAIIQQLAQCQSQQAEEQE